MARFQVPMTDQNGSQFTAYEDASTANEAECLAITHMEMRFPAAQWTIGEPTLRQSAKTAELSVVSDTLDWSRPYNELAPNCRAWPI